MVRWRVLVLFLSWAAISTAPAVAGAPETCRWRGRFAQTLGIDLQGLPRNGEAVRYVDATVIRPDRLFDLGLISVKKGDRIKLLCVGDNQWRIRHYATGLVIFFSVEPPRSGDTPP